jgi:hypothetical protein
MTVSDISVSPDLYPGSYREVLFVFSGFSFPLLTIKE